MSKQKRAPAEPEPPLCGCNPAIVAEVIVVVARNDAILKRVGAKIEQDPHVAIMASTSVSPDPWQLVKGCAGHIANLSKALRDLADVLDAPLPDEGVH